jgi:hypothetical protein
MQTLVVFHSSSDDRGRSEGDAANQLEEWMQENKDMRIVAMTGDRHQLIVVAEPSLTS